MPEIDALAECLTACDPETDQPMSAAAPIAPDEDVVSLDDMACDSVTPAHAALSRKIGRGLVVELPHLNALFSVHRADDTGLDWSDSLALAGPFGTIEFAQGPRLLRALTGIDIGSDTDADDERQEWLHAALVGRLAGTPLACAEHLMQHAQPETDDVFTLRITLRTSRHAVVTHARADAAGWLDFLGRTSWMRQRLPFDDFAGLPYETRLPFAHHTLPGHAFRTLATGDIILAETNGLNVNGVGFIQMGVIHAEAYYAPPNFLVIQEVKLNESELNESEPGDITGESAAEDHEGAYGESLPPGPPQPEEPDGPSEVDVVPVTLDFELGKVRMSLGNLRALGKGTILEIEGGSPSSILIRSGGRLLGRGEVVKVNNRVAIRIIEWGMK